MILYPYNSPLILTDELFARLNGNIDTTPYDLRQMAYVIAESAMYYDMETPLQVTTFTGTYPVGSRILLDHAYVNNVNLVRILDGKGQVVQTITGSTYDMSLEDADFGILSLNPYCFNVCYSSYGTGPYHAQVIYTAGLASGTSYDARILLGLVSYATIQINEMIGFGNETTGDQGVDTFKSLDYFEKRMPMLRTAYGNSAKANYIHQLIAPYRKRRHPGW